MKRSATIMQLSKRSTCWVVRRLSFLERAVWSSCHPDIKKNSHLLHPVPWIPSRKIFPEAIGWSSIRVLESTVEGSAAAFREHNIVHCNEALFPGMLDGLKRKFNPCLLQNDEKDWLKGRQGGLPGVEWSPRPQPETTKSKSLGTHQKFTWRRFHELSRPPLSVITTFSGVPPSCWL